MSEQSPSIKELLGEIGKDASRLLAAQKELAQVEMAADKKTAAQMGGLFGVAAAAGASGGFFLLFTAAYGLVALGLDEWAAFGVVTLTLFVTAGLAGAIGYSRSKKISGLSAAKSELNRTKDALSAITAGAPGSEVAVAPSSLPATSATAS